MAAAATGLGSAAAAAVNVASAAINFISGGHPDVQQPDVGPSQPAEGKKQYMCACCLLIHNHAVLKKEAVHTKCKGSKADDHTQVILFSAMQHVTHCINL